MIEVFVGLLVLAVPAAGVAVVAYLLVRLNRLDSEVRKLREFVAARTAPRFETPHADAPRPSAPVTEAPPVTPAPAVPPQPVPIFRSMVPPPASTTPSPPTPTGPSSPVGAGLAPPATRVKPKLEDQILSRLPGWIGSVALFLAGAFLVKFTFDRGLLGPTARVALGILFGVALVVGGEIARRRYATIAQGLSAAGIADLYASLLAGVTLYHLIPRALGFGLLAAVTATAVVLSLRHGVLIAALGLVGGFLSPALIGSTEPNAPALFSYLFLLEVGLLLAARPKRWWPLAALTLAGATAWSLAWIGFFLKPGDEATLGLFLLGTVGAFLAAATWRAEDDTWGPAPARWWLTISASALGALLLAGLVWRAGFGTLEWVFFGILTAGTLVLARFEERSRALPWFAALLGLALLSGWADRPDVALGGVRTTAFLFGGLVALGAYAVLWTVAKGAAHWAALASGAAAAYFLCAWSITRAAPPSVGWGVVALVLAVVWIAMTIPVARRLAAGAADAEPDRDARLAVAALAAGATFFISAAVPFELDRFALTVAWALEVAALAWIGERLRVRELRWLAGVLAALVLARLLVNPALFDYPLNATPILNWILFGYGVPLLAFWAAGRAYARGLASRESWIADMGAVVLALALLALEVRHWFHGADGKLGTEAPGVAEWGAVFLLWMLLGLGLARAARTVDEAALHRRALRDGSLLAGLLGMTGALALLGVGANPLLAPLPVGTTPIFNAVLFAYGLCAAAALLFARTRAAATDIAGARYCFLVGLLLALLCVTLEVRQSFHGNLLQGGTTSSAEMYTYSAAFVVFGSVLLVLAIVTKGVILRWASLAVMLLAVVKVFLFDLSALRDLYRVFSLLGLGASLLLLAFLYQRFVFRSADS